jgi:hypothetical protein
LLPPPFGINTEPWRFDCADHGESTWRWASRGGCTRTEHKCSETVLQPRMLIACIPCVVPAFVLLVERNDCSGPNARLKGTHDCARDPELFGAHQHPMAVRNDASNLKRVRALRFDEFAEDLQLQSFCLLGCKAHDHFDSSTAIARSYARRQIQL